LVKHHLDPKGIYFNHVLTRKDCRISKAGGIKYIGDLNRAPDRVMAIDNSVAAFSYDLDNLIPIKSWYDKMHDTELLKCLDIVDAFYSSGLDDVRNFLNPIFGLNARVNSPLSLSDRLNLLTFA
jgi:TFIIF-interacting CTD phosphatase-like protein